MTRLSKEQLLLMQKQLIDRYGGSHGIRDEGLLDSALAAPFQSFSGVDFYPTPLGKAVRLCSGLVHNHPFIDGNKRIGALALLVMLDLNHIEIIMSSKALEDAIFSLASGDMSDEIFLEWVRDHTG
ncbi:MAG: Fic family protein [Oscillospiraceae bacterium]|nr:Fic family protein [Oscillospiraceae bacterium]